MNVGVVAFSLSVYASQSVCIVVFPSVSLSLNQVEICSEATAKTVHHCAFCHQSAVGG